MKTVRIKKGKVCEIIPDYALPVEQWYGAEFAAQCVEAPDEVEQHWTYDPTSGTFSAPDPNAGLDAAKMQRITQSKTDLAEYLATHPLTWTDGEQYSITAEKQQQLTSKIMSATMAQTMSADYHLTWNSTGEVCKEWTLADLTALAFAIDARVTALVTYQQTQEVAMRSAATMEALDAIEVNYDSVQ